MDSERDLQTEHACLSAPAIDECVIIRRARDGQPAELVAYETRSLWSTDGREAPCVSRTSDAASVARVLLSRIPLGADGRMDPQQLAALPVLDEALIERWQQLLGALPGMHQVLVARRPTAPPLSLIHRCDVLPEGKTVVEPVSSNARENRGSLATPNIGDASGRPAEVSAAAIPLADEMPRTLPEVLRRAAKMSEADNLIYVSRSGGELKQSYGSLLRTAERIMAGLRAGGLKAGDKAILQLQQNEDILPAFWGCVLGGIVPLLVAVPPTYEQPNRALDQLRHLWSVLEQPLMITTDALGASLAAAVGSSEGNSTKIVSIDELREHEPDGEHWPCRPEDPALFSLTSGSTSSPKCVVLTHRNLLARAAAANELGRHGAEDVVLNWLPLDHIASISDWHVRCVLLGCRMVYAPKDYVISQPLGWLELIAKYHVSHTWAPNFAYALVSDLLAKTTSRPWDLSTVAAMLTAGEAVSASTIERFSRQLAPCGLKPTAIRPAFGMAEMASGVTYYVGTEDAPLTICSVRRSSLSGRLEMAAPGDPDAVSFVSLGPPIPGVSLRIVDAEGNVVPQETVGQLHVRGEPVSSGYYRAAEANGVFHEDGWFETGDLGLLRDGELYLTGRAKDSIIVNGANYGCGEIEEVVDSIPGVEASFTAACTVRGRDSGQEQWAVFFHTAQTVDGKLAQLLKKIRGRLVRQIGIKPDYLVPLDKQSIPKTGIGKLQRSELGRRFEAGQFDAILKRLDLLEANERTLPDEFYVPCWRRKELVNPLAAQHGQITLLFLDETTLGETLARMLAERGHTVVTVRPGSEYEELSANSYRLATDRPEQYRRLIEFLSASQRMPDRIVWLESVGQGGRSLLAMVEALAGGLEGDSPHRLVRLLVVSAENRGAVGCVRAVAETMSWLRCRHVECTAEELEADAAHILAELDDLSGDLEVAYRRQVRWVAGLERVRLAERPLQDCPVGPGSICLIGGEPTDVAVELARTLVRWDVKLLVVARRQPGDRVREAWESALAACGDAVSVEGVDVLNSAALHQAVLQAERRWQRRCESVLYIAGAKGGLSALAVGGNGRQAATGTLSLRDIPVNGLVADAAHSQIAEVAALASVLQVRQRGVLLTVMPADGPWDVPIPSEQPCLCYGIATDPTRGAISLTPSQLRDSILAGWLRGLTRLVVGLDGRHPAVRRLCNEGTCAAESLVAYVIAPQDWSPSERGLTLPDRFGVATRCEIVIVDQIPSSDTAEVSESGLARQGVASESLWGASGNEVERRLSEIWRDVLQLARVGVHDNLFELGGNSVLLVQLHSRIEAAFGPRLSVVDMFKYPTVASLARLLAAPADRGADGISALRGRQRAEARRQSQSATRGMEVAVIGLACRLPGANNVAQFWRNLAEGVESISLFTEEQVLAAGIDPELVRNPGYVRAAPVLEGIDHFDADFFGYTAREAELMDPQQRVLLECAWEAMEDAGYDLRRHPGAVGVFVSGLLNTYLLNYVYPSGAYLDGDVSRVMTLSSTGGFQVMIANDKDYLPTRISYKLNLRGPSVNVQTACSSSLVAIHTAAQSLLRGECDMALAGGVSISVPQETGYLYQEGLLVSPDGHCRAFDADAQGTVFGNGAGLVLLKRLDEAVADGDHIYAVIKGSAVNNDGGQKAGYLAPSQEGQAAVVAEALSAAGVSAESISYVEAHGTGTALGDPIEIAGLSQGFRADTDRGQFCAVGSVKTNVGHLQIASGVVGFLKAVLCLHHGQLAGSLHFRVPNPRINFVGSPFYVNTRLVDWPEGDYPRRAAVNSLGIGGTNAHVILEEAPHVPRPAPVTERPVHILTLSAKTPEALRELAGRYASALETPSEASLGDVCFTAATGRAHFAHRLAVLAETNDQARRRLRNALDGRAGEGVWSGEVEVAAGGGGTGWPQREAFESIEWQVLLMQAADRYVRGLPVDWGELYRAPQRRRVSLPTYPFQRKRHWIQRLPTAVSGRGAGGASGEAKNRTLDGSNRADPARSSPPSPVSGRGNPLLGRQVSSPALKDAVFESAMNLESMPILDDHRFCGIAILPGAFQLAMVVEAASRLGLPAGCAIEDVSFAQAVALPEGEQRIVQLIFSAGEGGDRSFRLVSRRSEDADQPQWTVHSTGRLAPAATEDDQLPAEVREAQERLMAQPRRMVTGEEFYASMQEHQVRLGPKLQAVETGWVGQDEILCRFCVPGALAGSDDRLAHAVLLDACVQVLGGIEQYPGELTRLPVGVQRFQFLNRCTAVELWCYLRVRPPDGSTAGQWAVDAWLFEPEGRIIAVFRGLALYDVPRETLLEALGDRGVDWIYRPAWIRQAQLGNGVVRRATGGDPWLILADKGGVGDRLAAGLHERGQRCVLVRRSEHFESEGESLCRVNPQRPEHFLRLVEISRGTSAAGYRGVVHLWSLDQDSDSSGLGDLWSSCASTLHMIQALDRAGSTTGLTMCLVTRGAQAVDDHPGPVSVWQTPLWGLGRTAALEYQEMEFLRVDLDSDRDDRQVELLLRELLSAGREPEVALRGTDRYVARLQRHRLDSSTVVSIRSDATYLIAGGTGGMGLEVASWLVEQGARHLVLVSRRGASSDAAREAVAEWRSRGVELLAAAADIAQESEMAELFTRIRAQMPALRGIVHAAGIREDATLQSLSWEQFQTVLAAKALGAWNLHRLTEGLALDFFVGFSSIASVLGSPGQANYAAANAFLDGLMHQRRAANLPGLAVNWGLWKGAGMLASLDELDRDALTRRGLLPLEPAVAIRALAALMQNGVAQAAAVEIDWQRYLQAIGGKGTPPLLEALIAQADSSPAREGAFRLRLEEVPAEERSGRLLEHVQELIGNLLGGESAAPLDPDCGFYDLGLDSLSVLMLRNRLQSDLGLALPATVTFKFSTVRALAGHLAENLGLVSLPPADERDVDVADGERGLAAVLDELSLPEMADRLAEKLDAIRRDHGEP